MLVTQCQQLYGHQKKARLVEGKKTQGSRRALEARVDVLEGKKQTTVGMRANLLMKSLKLITEIIQPLIEKE